ncbi:MAG: hypothetical protein IJP70_03135 [Bacteroidales bacterium]|nr:hypothetical protein [Bacteroidales bacterium]
MKKILLLVAVAMMTTMSVSAQTSVQVGYLLNTQKSKDAYNYYDNDSRRFNLILGGGVWCDIKETVRVKAGHK